MPLSGWPGVKNVKFTVSGAHPYVVAAAFPWELNSETARERRVVEVDQSGWIPEITESNKNQAYLTYSDFLVAPHQTVKATFVHNPAFDSFAIGLSRESGLWDAFPDGGTFCEHTQTLYLEPSKMNSCLGNHVATLSCNPTGPLYCQVDSTVPVSVNGKTVKENYRQNVVVAPFDFRILLGTDDKTQEACDILQSDYFYGNSSLVVGPFGSGLSLQRKGKDIVPPLQSDARLPRYVLYCATDYIDEKAIVVGALQSGLSFYYSPSSNTVELYTTRENTMKNTWEDVIILNLCILCLMHFFADAEKDVTEPWTVVPELLGVAVTLAGIVLQNSDNGVYKRVSDVTGGDAATYALTASIFLQVSAHLACIGLLYARRDAKGAGIPKELEQKCETIRRLTTECSLLGSIFLQVLSGSQTMFDSYVGFMAGVVLVYNGTYRTFETVVGSNKVWKKNRTFQKNHPLISFMSMGTLAVSAWAFYAVGAVPSIDPVSGLSEHITEVSSLALTLAFTLGGIGLANQYV